VIVRLIKSRRVIDFLLAISISFDFYFLSESYLSNPILYLQTLNYTIII